MNVEEFEKSIISCPDIDYEEAFTSLITKEEAAEIIGIALNTDSLLVADPHYDWTTTTSAPHRLTTLYNCKYCGTEYIADMTGFIPNCHNCGAKMERVDEYKIR